MTDELEKNLSDIKNLANNLGIKPKLITSIVFSTEKFYRTFKISKKKGGYREISAPRPILLDIQKWILENILANNNLSESAHGFISGKSIITNAKSHLGKKALLKIDLKDFFPSINICRVVELFKHQGFAPNISFFLARICCFNNCLPQGAPTSPFISNIIAKRLDSKIERIAEKYEINYTRYADDLIFSGDIISEKFIKVIKKIINQEGFSPNENKTKLIIGRKKRKIVTGISITNDIISIPKNTKRIIRQELYFLQKNGFFEHTKRIHNFNPLYIEELIGKFSFWLHVEPENSFAKKSLTYLHNLSRNPLN